MRDDPIDRDLQEAVDNRDRLPPAKGMMNMGQRAIIDRKAVANYTCTYCGAREGERCETSGRNVAPRPHAYRVHLAIADLYKRKGDLYERKGEILTLRIDGTLAARLDRYRDSTPLPITQSFIVRAALSEYLDRHE